MNKIKNYKNYNGKYKGLKVEAVMEKEGSLVCTTGRINAYRMAFYQNRGGSTEKTWNKKLHSHDCCKSAVAWRHLRGCPALEKDFDIKETKEELLEKMFGN